MVQERFHTLEVGVRAEQPPHKLVPCLNKPLAPLRGRSHGKRKQRAFPFVRLRERSPPSLPCVPPTMVPAPTPHPAARPLTEMTTQDSLVVSIYLEVITKEITTC